MLFREQMAEWCFFRCFSFCFVLVMARQFFIIFGCLALGEAFVWATGVHLPSSIIGMLLLTLFLSLRWVRLEWVERLSGFLIANLGFFFVPPGVAIMLYWDVIEEALLPIVIATLVSTFCVLVVTGWTHQWVVRISRTRNKKKITKQ